MLPFETLEEAKIFVGRNLTSSEKLWFNYSAQKSDFLLYCHNILFLLFFYTLLPLPFLVMELICFEKIKEFKIQPKVSNSFRNMLDCYMKVMSTFVVSVGPLQIISYPTIKMIGIRTSLPLPTWQEMTWQILVYFLIEDYTNYWLHRLLHSNWAFQKIHHVHHQYTSPMAFSAPYAHWAEIIILGLASFLGPAMVPCHIVTFWLWMIVRQMESIDTHCGYSFPGNILEYIPFYGGSDFHDYHHLVGQKSHSNFASVFTYCDYIYGTNKGYRYHKEIFKKKMEEEKWK